MDVADAALYLTVVAEAKKAFVLADKSLVIIESFFEAGSDADDVPVVGDLALADGVVGLDADLSSSKLLDRDWRGGRGEVEQGVERLAVPAFAKEAAGADQAFCNAALKDMRSHSDIET